MVTRRIEIGCAFLFFAWTCGAAITAWLAGAANERVESDDDHSSDPGSAGLDALGKP
jgi:hypothetical protein